MEPQDLAGKSALDAFLAVYLIVAVIFTLVVNLILLGTVYLTSERRPDLGLCQIVSYGLGAGTLLLPLTIAAAADRNLIVAPGRGESLCQFAGALSAFLHRVSTFSLCCAYVDRCIVIAKPMSYTSGHRSIFRTVTTAFSLLVAVGLSLIPFALAANPSTAYSPLHSAPLCMFRPPAGEWRSFLYADAFLSYGISWMTVCVSSLGMLYIACVSAAANSKIAPINLGTFSEHPLASAVRRQRPLPTAWGIESTCSDADREKARYDCHPKPSHRRYSQHGSNGLRRQSTRLFQQSAIEGPPPRKRKSSEVLSSPSQSLPRADSAKEPPRKKSLIATFYDEVTLHCDGSADWRTCTNVSKARGAQKLAVQRQFRCQNVKNNRVITVSSSMYHDQGRGGSYPNRRKTFRKKPSRSRRNASRLNTKALFTLTSTLFVFTLITLPVFMLHLSLATRNPGEADISYGLLVLEFVSCVASLSVYAAYPFIIVMADKEVKNKIVQMLKRLFDNSEFIGEGESTSAILA